MSHINNKSKEELIDIKERLIEYFGSEDNLKKYWLTNNRRYIDKEMKELFNISFYYFKKILMTFPWFREKTKEEIEIYHVAAVQKTNVERYGVKCNWASKDPKLNGKQTLIERYGVAHNSQLLSWKMRVHDKWANKTKEERTLHINKILSTKHNSRHVTNKYQCCGINLDSYPELAYCVYNVLQGAIIEREPIVLDYYYKNKLYHYVPDFRINNQLVEIKARHWLDISDTRGRDYAKYKCMLDNNVLILFDEDYQFYIDWFEEHNWNKFDFTKEGKLKRSATAAMADLLN